MNYPHQLRAFRGTPSVALALIVSILFWFTGLPFALNIATAATVTQFSATASSSVPSASTNYSVRWTDATQITVGQSIKISFDPGNSTFDVGSLANNEVYTSSTTNMTVITTACGAVTPNQVSINAGISNAAGDKSVTLTACGTVATGTKTVLFTGSHVQNPASPGTYPIVIGGSQADSGTTLVAITNRVTLTASVATSFLFTVAGLASGQTVNGETTSTTTTATSIGFGVLTAGAPVVGGQELTVETNAVSGFIVTVKEDQNLTSSGGGQIYTFFDGGASSVPLVWASPSGTLGSPLTYSHFGVTSDDADLNGGEFSGTKYVGNFATTSRTIFSHSGAADGLTQNIGKARVAYKVEITDLQAAGSDYSNHLIYVCTPTF